MPNDIPDADIAIVSEIHNDLLLVEIVFPKPFCDLHLKPEDDKPVIRRFIAEFGIGRPEQRVEVDIRGRITHVEVLRSAPCGEVHGSWQSSYNA